MKETALTACIATTEAFLHYSSKAVERFDSSFNVHEPLGTSHDIEICTTCKDVITSFPKEKSPLSRDGDLDLDTGLQADASLCGELEQVNL